MSSSDIKESENRLRQLLSPEYQPLASVAADYNSEKYRLDIANLLTGSGFIRLDGFYNLHTSSDSHYRYFPFTETPSVNRPFRDVACGKLKINEDEKTSSGFTPADCVVVDTFGNPSKKVALLTHYKSVKDMKEKKLSSEVAESTELMSKHDFVPKENILDFKQVINRYGWGAAKQGVHPLKACLADGKIGRAQSGYALYDLQVLFSDKEKILTI